MRWSVGLARRSYSIIGSYSIIAKQFREFLTAVKGILCARLVYLRLKTTDFWATYENTPFRSAPPLKSRFRNDLCVIPLGYGKLIATVGKSIRWNELERTFAAKFYKISITQWYKACKFGYICITHGIVLCRIHSFTKHGMLFLVVLITSPKSKSWPVNRNCFMGKTVSQIYFKSYNCAQTRNDTTGKKRGGT